MQDEYFIGLMSGTSLDGIDAALVQFDPALNVIETFFYPYPAALKQTILALQHPTENELEKTALISNQLALLYAEAIEQLLKKTSINRQNIIAIGCHGQTIRHQPKYQEGVGYSLQIGNASLLTEKTNITVVSDFRNRDIAAGGQGAPLVPAFHQAVFSSQKFNRAIINIGGIANITYLPKITNNNPTGIFGFDSGPGNMLLDAWIQQQRQLEYDENGAWARAGKLIKPLLASMLTDTFFSTVPPKSTGRDLFNLHWLNSHLAQFNYEAQDIAHTLTMLTAHTIFDALICYCSEVEEIYVCGGGAHNQFLIDTLNKLLSQHATRKISIYNTDILNIKANWVEAIAFAWLAKKCIAGETASIPQVTGATGARILGTITHA